ncbi:MAG: ACP S-malonyltransferase [Paludibacteraceae bacterium]|nr:ACP S-malonyltransferase [Paludibacteraceae bacterium]
MKKAYIFPGQGAQFAGMGKDLYDNCGIAHDLFVKADDILGFKITDVMFGGTDEDLRRTDVTQPAVYLHSVISYLTAVERGLSKPDMVAGHSLGEFSALVAAGALDFESGLRLVSARAHAMQEACELQRGTMAAVLKMEDKQVEQACESICDDVVVAANYNSPGQVVISGTVSGVERATEALKVMGGKRIVPLSVGGAFHSPLMQPAAEKLEKAIRNTQFNEPKCSIYQNVNALPQTDPERIAENLIRQLTSPVRWTQTVKNMLADGAAEFIEFGPGQVLCGLVKKIAGEAKYEVTKYE